MAEQTDWMARGMRGRRQALGRARRRAGAAGAEARARVLRAGGAVRVRHVLVAAEPRHAQPKPVHRRAARRARQARRAAGLHLHGALNLGITREELIEVLMQTACYAGVPAAVQALNAAADVLGPKD